MLQDGEGIKAVSWAKAALKTAINQDIETLGQEEEVYDDPNDEVDGESSDLPDMDADNDGLDHPCVGDEDSEEEVNIKDAKFQETMLKKTKRKTYKLKPVTRTIGLKINNADKYFMPLAQDKFKKIM